MQYYYRVLYLANDKFADNDPVIIPYKAVNHQFIAIYGITIVSLTAYYL